MIAYHRTALAQQLVQALQGKALLGDAHSGLFLAAQDDLAARGDGGGGLLRTIRHGRSHFSLSDRKRRRSSAL